MRRISVFLVDDHTVVRQAVRLMLEAEEDIVVCGEADEADSALRDGRFWPIVGVFLIHNTMAFSVVQRREAIGTLRALGLRRINHTVEHPDRPEIRGMVDRVPHLVTVEEVA